MNWHSYFQRTLGLKHRAVRTTVTSPCSQLETLATVAQFSMEARPCSSEAAVCGIYLFMCGRQYESGADGTREQCSTVTFKGENWICERSVLGVKVQMRWESGGRYF